MRAFFGEIVGLPLRIIASLISGSDSSRALPLLRAVWKVSRNPEDARRLLAAAYELSAGLGRSEANSLLASTNDARVYAVAAMHQHVHSREPGVIESWRRVAPETLRHLEQLIYLDMLASRDDDAAVSAAEQIAARRDLPSFMTESALYLIGRKCVERRQWERARSALARVLAVNERAMFRVAMLAAEIGMRVPPGERHLGELAAPTNENRVAIASAHYLAGDEAGAERELGMCTLDFLKAATFPPELGPMVQRALDRKEREARG